MIDALKQLFFFLFWFTADSALILLWFIVIAVMIGGKRK